MVFLAFRANHPELTVGASPEQVAAERAASLRATLHLGIDAAQAGMMATDILFAAVQDRDRVKALPDQVLTRNEVHRILGDPRF